MKKMEEKKFCNHYKITRSEQFFQSNYNLDLNFYAESKFSINTEPKKAESLNESTIFLESSKLLRYVLQDHSYVVPPLWKSTSSPLVTVQQRDSSKGKTISVSQPLQVNYDGSENSSYFHKVDDDHSFISSDVEREPEDEETETAPEAEDEDGITKCICDFDHDDGYMICCDRCSVWQHVDCMGIDRNDIPDEYLCEICNPRSVEKQRARLIQMRKREEILDSDTNSNSSSFQSEEDKNEKLESKDVRRVLKKKPSEHKKIEIEQKKKKNIIHENLNARKNRKPLFLKKNKIRKKSLKKERDSIPSCRKKNINQDIPSYINLLKDSNERYEKAFTNHYSPELRARILNLKSEESGLELLQRHLKDSSRYRVHVCNDKQAKIISTMKLSTGTPIVELRGKYMLRTQHWTYKISEKLNVPNSFLFFYHLIPEGIEICIDAISYGNEARFIRRSCKPNAQMKHFIEKGTLHLYIISTQEIENQVEITLNHDNINVPFPHSMPIFCACNNSEDCLLKSMNNDSKENKRYNNLSPRKIKKKPNSIHQPDFSSEFESTVRKNLVLSTLDESSHLSKFDNEIANKSDEKVLPIKTLDDKTTIKIKLTREERKMQAILKAFERLEKAEQKKQENRVRTSRKDAEAKIGYNKPSSENFKSIELKEFHRIKPAKRKKRRSCKNSNRLKKFFIGSSSETDSCYYKFSCEEKSKVVDTKKKCKNYIYTNSKACSNIKSKEIIYDNSQSEEESSVSIKNIKNSKYQPSEKTIFLASLKSPTADSCASSSSQCSTPSTPLSSACMLVAAAVGPLAPDFKFPKTKRVLMNEWLRESSEINSNLPIVSSTRNNKSPISLEIIENECNYINQKQNFIFEDSAMKEFDSQENKSVSISKEPAFECKQDSLSLCTAASRDSAKKRWLRQAISEECESPNIYFESASSELLAPPKKRRIARESVSSDNYTPPTTPIIYTSEYNVSNTLQGNEDDLVNYVSSSTQEEISFQKFYSNVNLEEAKLNYANPLVVHSSNFNKYICEKHQDVLINNKQPSLAAQNNSPKEKQIFSISENNYLEINKDKQKNFNNDLYQKPDEIVLKNVILSQTNQTNFKTNLSNFEAENNIDKCNLSHNKFDITKFASSYEPTVSDKLCKKTIDRKQIEKQKTENIFTNLDSKVLSNEVSSKVEKTNINVNSEENNNFKKLKKIKNLNLNELSLKDQKLDTAKHFHSSSPQCKSIIIDFEKPCSNKSQINLNQKVQDIDRIEYVDCSKKVNEKIFKESSNKSWINTDSVNTHIMENRLQVIESILPLSERIKKKSNPSFEMKINSTNQNLSLSLEKQEKFSEEKANLISKSEFKKLLQTDIELQKQGINQQYICKEMPFINNKHEDKKETISSHNRRLTLEDNKFFTTEITSYHKSNMSLMPILKSSPVKKKLSISEYRLRKGQLKQSLDIIENDEKLSITDNPKLKTNSPLPNKCLNYQINCKNKKNLEDIHNKSLLSVDEKFEGENKKDPQENIIGWSASPTLVERQRENLTTRLKREFGLFLNDEEDQKFKFGASSESQTSLNGVQVNNNVSLELSTSSCSTVVFKNKFIKNQESVNILTNNKDLGSVVIANSVPQAPPGSNPYPPNVLD